MKKDDGKKGLTQQERKEAMSIGYTTPSVSSALVLNALHNGVDLCKLMEQLQERNKDVIDGDLRVAEAMLIDNAHVLNSIFTEMTVSMVKTEYISHMEAYGKLALRAQNQCQRTLKTLLEYKNPKRATFIKQQNNAVNQQINQGEQPQEISGKTDSANELLEINHDARLDPRAPQEAVRSDQTVEAVEEIDRTAHGTG